MNGSRIASLCSGYGGLEMAIQAVYGGDTIWHADPDPGAARILAHHWPTVPNLGDLTTTNWQAVVDEHGHPDIVCGGYPCQPFSTAGKRKGTSDERHIWPHIADALRVLRPRVAIFENVAGHLRLGFDTVLADLAALGFDAEWCLVRASEVGAPHRRERLFILADASRLGHERGGDARGRGDGPADHSQPPADASRLGRGEGRAEPAWLQRGPDAVLGRRAAAADADSACARAELHREPEVRQSAPLRDDARRLGVQRGPAADADPGRRGAAEQDLRPRQPAADWGRFAPAVHRWEAVIGRRAPWATDDRNRLSPAFVEWLMGLPAGHVTAVPDLTRTQQLKALGNGVVPQQAAGAIRLLAARAGLTTRPSVYAPAA